MLRASPWNHRPRPWPAGASACRPPPQPPGKYGTSRIRHGDRILGPAHRFRSALLALLLGAMAVQPAPAAASDDPDRYDHAREEPNSIHAGALSVQLMTFGSGTNGIYT